MMLVQDNCGLLIIDIQGQLARMVQRSELVIANTVKLIRCAHALSMPVIWVEQNPQGLGITVSEISKAMAADNIVLEKFHFSALSQPSIEQAINSSGRNHWLVAGIESHVCVYQTVLSLLECKLDASVVSDCVSSRLQSNIDLALANMRQHGAHITSLEMAIFELMGSAKHPKFREILAIIK